MNWSMFAQSHAMPLKKARGQPSIARTPPACQARPLHNAPPAHNTPPPTLQVLVVAVAAARLQRRHGQVHRLHRNTQVVECRHRLLRLLCLLHVLRQLGRGALHRLRLLRQLLQLGRAALGR